MTKTKYGKPKMICPFCQERQDNGEFRAFAVNGMSMHIRMMHPESYEEFQTHRQQFIDRFACDDDGVLTGGHPAEVEPVMEEEAIPEQEYEEPTPPPVKKPKPIPEEPKQEEFPDDRDPEPERSVYNPYGY